MRKAFTLAETLITLGIIGVVCALTIPSLIQKHQERTQIIKLKKVYSILNTAFNTAIAKNGDINTWTSEITYRNQSTEQDNAINNILKQYFNYIKYCEKGNSKECTMPDYVDINKNKLSNRNEFNTANPTIILADGTVIKIKTVVGDYENLWCKYPVTNLSSAYSRYMYKCGRIYVDLNGKKGPNKDGYDIFGFTFYQNTITPMGMKNDHDIENFKICIGTSSYKNHNNGGTCTAWALINENMDYLHCPKELSWDGKKTCK